MSEVCLFLLGLLVVVQLLLLALLLQQPRPLPCQEQLQGLLVLVLLRYQGSSRFVSRQGAVSLAWLEELEKGQQLGPRRQVLGWEGEEEEGHRQVQKLGQLLEELEVGRDHEAHYLRPQLAGHHLMSLEERGRSDW
jgi:hypothetical protein